MERIVFDIAAPEDSKPRPSGPTAEGVALGSIVERLDHTAAMAELLSFQLEAHLTTESQVARGIAKTIGELAERLDGILNPPATIGGR